MVHINVRSLYKKIEEISILYSKFDLILCSETWLDKRYTDAMINISGYQIFRLDRCNADPMFIQNGEVPKRGGGVIVYVKSKWAKFIRIFNPGTVITRDYEIITLLLDKPGMKHMSISCVYRPPMGIVDSIIVFLMSLLDHRTVLGREKWFVGDFNIDFLKRNSNKMNPIKHFLKECGLRQIICEGTRFTQYGNTCIDWIITDCDYIDTNGVLNDLLSDHFPVFVNRKKKRECIVREWKTIRHYKKFNGERFGDLLNEIDWLSYDLEDDVNKMWDIIIDKIYDILSIMCPIKRVYIRSRKSPWMTPNIICYIKQRNRISKIFRKTGSPHMFELAKYLRNKVTTLIRNAKSVYIQENLHINRNNPMCRQFGWFHHPLGYN